MKKIKLVRLKESVLPSSSVKDAVVELNGILYDALIESMSLLDSIESNDDLDEDIYNKVSIDSMDLHSLLRKSASNNSDLANLVGINLYESKGASNNKLVDDNTIINELSGLLDDAADQSDKLVMLIEEDETISEDLFDEVSLHSLDTNDAIKGALRKLDDINSALRLTESVVSRETVSDEYGEYEQIIVQFDRSISHVFDSRDKIVELENKLNKLPGVEYAYVTASKASVEVSDDYTGSEDDLVELERNIRELVDQFTTPTISAKTIKEGAVVDAMRYEGDESDYDLGWEIVIDFDDDQTKYITDNSGVAAELRSYLKSFEGVSYVYVSLGGTSTVVVENDTDEEYVTKMATKIKKSIDKWFAIEMNESLSESVYYTTFQYEGEEAWGIEIEFGESESELIKSDFYSAHRLKEKLVRLPGVEYASVDSKGAEIEPSNPEDKDDVYATMDTIKEFIDKWFAIEMR